MSQKTKAQIQAESNSTYVDNTVGSITPANVRTLNTDWIDSIVFLDMTGSFVPTNAVSASYAATASFLLGSIASASYAINADTASLAVTASFAISASRAITAASATSAATATSASYSVTSSLATQNLTTASAVANILTFTKGDGTTFNVTIAQSGSVASASYADVANFANSANSASYAFTASSATNAANSISASYAFTASSAERSTTASFAISASRAISAATAVSATTATSALSAISASFASTAGTANTASFVAGVPTLAGNNTFTGINTFNNNVTMSNVQVNGTASIAFLNVVFQSSSIIYSSGSNQFGDASNDTQTLWGTVNVISGPLVVTGSSNFKSAFTASGLNYPTADGVLDQFVTTNGAGALSFDWVKTLHQNIRNRESVSIVRGTPLFVSGSTGDNADVYIADASNPSRRPATLIAYDATLAASATGTAIISGEIQGVNTTGYAAGTVIYLAAGGGWTSTRPIGSSSVQVLGVVTSEAINGRGLVFNQVADLLPNITEGYTWVGDANAVPQPVTTSSLSVASAVSSSYALSASFSTSASFAKNANTASFTPNAFVSASNYLTNDTIVLYKEGGASNNVTINNVQSASYADNANTANSATTATNATSASLAQLALTASYFDGLVASASYALVAETANNALTANTANSALTAINADTASFLNGNAVSASYAATASVLLGTVTSASYALTSSGVQGINASAVNSTYYLGFVPNAEINALSIDTDLSYNPSTGILAATQFNGSLNGNANTATTATSAVTASFATNFRNSGSYVITGSHRGNVVSESIASSTASIDFADGNFFDLRLIGGANTHITAVNIQAGQTANLRITQGATTGSVTFSSAFDQVSGSAYTPTAVSGAMDILTFITFDNSIVYVSNIKNLV